MMDGYLVSDLNLGMNDGISWMVEWAWSPHLAISAGNRVDWSALAIACAVLDGRNVNEHGTGQEIGSYKPVTAV
jgi:hypothetical protein